MYDSNDRTHTILFTIRSKGEAKVVEGYTEPRENSPYTKNTVICEVKKFSSSRPIVFESIPPSVTPTTHFKPRTTRVLSSVTSLVQEDETKQFDETDKINQGDFFDNIKRVHLIKIIKLFVFIRHLDSGENFDYKSLPHGC